VDTTTIVYSGLIIGAVAVFIAVIAKRAKRQREAQSWPSTEGTVQSAAIETVGSGRSAVELPCFAFSYVVDGEYYSGRFSLSAHGDQADELVKKLGNVKFSVQYDPAKPASYYLPDDEMEGFEVGLVAD
jgi:hypothetical protein